MADEIREYVTKYGLLIANKEYFFEENLKGASYSMRPDPEDAWEYNEKGEPGRLEVEEDDEGKYYRVKQNSLVYIRLQQDLRLPFYMIGRHNLTIKYVYQGLLLGTGPQVDPGWFGKIYIPLHNFTNRDVKIYLHKSFVSIDFVRTSHLILDKGIPSSRKDFIERYPEKRPIPESKTGKSTLSDYLKGATPISFLQEFIPRVEEQEKNVKGGLSELEKARKGLARRKYVDWALLAAIITIAVMAYFHLDDKLDSKIPIILEQGKQISAISERLDALSVSVTAFTKSKGT
ncbi:MAG: hypothetical protein JRJ69_12395, partial [Deltaproteobacteria bacterium]|nr:hypothetical protein [Deltaproteobacteria bacterium]